MKILFKRIGAASLLVAVLAGVTQAHAQEDELDTLRRSLLAPEVRATARRTSPAQPTTPPGLDLAGRSVLSTANTYAPTGEVVVTAITPQGRASRALLWVESPDSHEVGTGAGAAVLPLDAAAADSTTATVIVHDAYGSHVTLSTRKYLTESIELSVQVDAQGHLLTLPTVRLAWNKTSGVFVFSRDNAVGLNLIVHYRVFDLRGNDVPNPTQEETVTIPAGAASVTIPQLTYGFGVIAYAGSLYTTAPSENSDNLLTLVTLQ